MNDDYSEETAKLRQNLFRQKKIIGTTEINSGHDQQQENHEQQHS